MYTPLEHDLDEMEELRYQDIHDKKMAKLFALDPRDPDYPEPDEYTQTTKGRTICKCSIKKRVNQ
jgi:hypothetical protein